MTSHGFCSRGHLITPENSLVNASGQWYCKKCFLKHRSRQSQRQKKHLPGLLPDPKPFYSMADSKFGLYDYDFLMASLTALEDDPFALVKDDTPEVLREIREGREITAAFVDKLPSVNMVQEILFRLERAIEGSRRVDREAAEKWLQRQPVSFNGFSQASAEHQKKRAKEKVERLKAELQQAEEELMNQDQPKRSYTRSSRGHVPTPGANQIAHRIVEQVIEQSEQVTNGKIEETPSVPERTSEGWSQPDSPSHYFRRRKTR